MNYRSRKINLMCHQLELHFNENRQIWENEDLVNTHISQFLDQNIQLNNLQTQRLALKGKYSHIRNQEQEMLNNYALQLAKTLMALNRNSTEFNSNEQHKKLNISKSSLLGLPLTESFIRISHILEEADIHRTQLEASPRTKSIYEQAKKHHSSFAQRLFLPTLRISERKVLLQNATILENKILELLNIQLDPRMNILEYDFPEFYHTYQNIRKTRIYKNNRNTLITNENQNTQPQSPVVELPQNPENQPQSPPKPDDLAIAV